MSQIMNLPGELILQIIDEVGPDDLVNFCLCCQKFENLGRDALSRHRYMVKTCSAVTGGDRGEDIRDHGGWNLGALYEPSDHPVTIIQAILANHNYRFFPRKITVGNCDFRGPWGGSHDPDVYSK